MMMTEKNCTVCKQQRPLTEFTKSSTSLDGLQSVCKACDAQHMATYKHSKPGLISSIYNSQKQSSKDRGHLPPSYTRHELAEWMNSQHNFDMLYLNWINSGWNRWKKPSVDRGDDYKPYTLGNLLRICTWQENFDRGHADRKNGINNKRSKAVQQLTLGGEFVAEHYSQNQAARAVGINQSNICAVCTGRRTQTGGFMWQYCQPEGMANG